MERNFKDFIGKGKQSQSLLYKTQNENFDTGFQSYISFLQ